VKHSGWYVVSHFHNSFYWLPVFFYLGCWYITNSKHQDDTSHFQCFIQGLTAQGQGLEIQGQGFVNWSSRTRTFLEDNNTWLQWRMAYMLTYISISDIYLTSISKTLFTVSSYTVAVTEFMDVTRSYIMHSLQNTESLKIFKDFVVQGQGLVNWFLILEDKDFPQGVQHWPLLSFYWQLNLFLAFLVNHKPETILWLWIDIFIMCWAQGWHDIYHWYISDININAW